jgi:hypothetical protein
MVISTDVISGPDPAEATFGPGHIAQDARFSSTIKHNLTTSNSLTSPDCATFSIEFVQCLGEHVMHETQANIEPTESDRGFRYPTYMTAKAKPHKPFEVESMSFAMAGHDLRQPLQNYPKRSRVSRSRRSNDV